MTQRIRASLFSGLAALVALACATADTTPVPAPTAASTERMAPGRTERQNVVTVSAVVESIDQATRVVTLRRSDDSRVTFRVDDSVRNLAQVRRGDVVSATYFESVVVNLRRPGEATPGVSAAGATDRSALGSMPGAAQAKSVTVVATIRGLDRENQKATLEDSKGNLTTVDVRNPQHFDVAKVGDLVEITYTEAVAIAVDKP